MSRPTQVTINLLALRNNLQLVRELTGKKVIGVIKADAYGHGALPIARVLEQQKVDSLAVACLEEAIALREGGIKTPILLLEGFFSEQEIPLIEHYRLSTVIQQFEQINALERWQGSTLNIWLKIDTGMHRIGFLPHQFASAYARLKACPRVNRIVLMTHFSSADQPEKPKTQAQIALFNTVTNGLVEQTCLCNSAGIMQWPTAYGDWVRPGIMLYGSSPFIEPHPLDKRLQPVMEFTSQIFSIHKLPAGAPIGYGETYITDRPMSIGVVATGYADGYPRNASSGMPILVNGQKARVVGRISMDMMTVDLTHLPESKIGDTVTLWGRDLPATEVAHHAGTISYEMFCNLKRAKIQYIGE